MNRYFRELLEEYRTNDELVALALIEGGERPRSLKGLFVKAPEASGQYPMRGTYDNGIPYSRRFRLTNTYHKGLAHIISVKINRLIKRRLKQRMAPIKAKRSGTEVHVFVARGNWQALEGLLPSIFHTTNMIYKYFEKDYNLH